MSKISYERLKEVVLYDPATGHFTWTQKAYPRSRGQRAGTKACNGYVMVQIDGQKYLGHRLAWLYMHGVWPEHHLDHANRVRDDNRIENLRGVTRSENMQNTGLSPSNTSGFKGVYLDKRWNHWRAKIKINGRAKHLGCFKTPELAAAAYRLAAEAMHTHNPVVDA